MVDPVVPALPTYPDAVFVGHANADVDSLCSAIVAAHLFGTRAVLDAELCSLC
jgi:inorganic pyrophosphatase/exopolyphosphatase